MAVLKQIVIGPTLTRQKAFAVVDKLSSDALAALVVKTSKEIVAGQIALDNPPTSLRVDYRNNTPIDQARKNVVVMFGTALAVQAMALVESTLQASINLTTNAKTGRLSNMDNWEWRFVPKNGAVKVITSPDQIKAFNYGDRLVLFPKNVPYATVTNRAVKQGSKSLTGKVRTRGAKKGTGTNQGFLAHTAMKLRGVALLNQFTAYVGFSRIYTTAGELSKVQGTGFLVIKLKSRTRR